MNYVLPGAAHHLEPAPEQSLKRSEANRVRPQARERPTRANARPHLASRIVAAWSTHRTDRLPHTVTAKSSTRVSPIAASTSRGIAFLISR